MEQVRIAYLRAYENLFLKQGLALCVSKKSPRSGYFAVPAFSFGNYFVALADKGLAPTGTIRYYPHVMEIPRRRGVIIPNHMHKNFDGWNKQKKKLHESKKDVFFHEREVWWCSLGVNVVYEQDGTNELFERPVLILKKFNRDVLWAVPLTRSEKHDRYYHPITIGGENSVVILSQLRLISSKRLQRFMHRLPQGQFKQVVRLVQQFFPLP